MNNPKLTYVITTFNKIFFLKMVVADLIENCADDEDIVIVDGGSTDGSVAYLESIKDNPKISNIVSEKDKGEAHGFNKALLLAKGDLIKIITDDDVFHWPSVRACKNFMIKNPDIDLSGSNGAGLNLNSENIFVPMDYSHDYKKWKSRNMPFAFCGLGLMMRRTSIPLLGLFDLTYILVDAEFSLRTTSKNVNLVWLATPSWVRIANDASNSVKYFDKCVSELVKLNYIYLNKFSFGLILLNRLKRIIKRYLKKKNNSILTHTEDEKIKKVFAMGRAWLEANSNPESNELILRK